MTSVRGGVSAARVVSGVSCGWLGGSTDGATAGVGGAATAGVSGWSFAGATAGEVASDGCSAAGAWVGGATIRGDGDVRPSFGTGAGGRATLGGVAGLSSGSLDGNVC